MTKLHSSEPVQLEISIEVTPRVNMLERKGTKGMGRSIGEDYFNTKCG